MSTSAQVEKIAVNLWHNVLSVSPEDNGPFKMLVSMKTEDSTKPLLLVGNVHGRIQDGYCIGVLNPDKSLCDELVPSGYSHKLLTEIVTGRCDLMVNVWIDAYKDKPVSSVHRYTARKCTPAKFVVA
jgi:hypothetical protein